MTRRAKLTAGIFAGLLTLVFIVAVYLLVPRRAGYALYGTEIITTTASGEQLGSLLHQTAWALGGVNDLGDGRRHFPSFHQSGRSWTQDGQAWTENAGKIIANRSITEFDNRNGHHCKIEAVSIADKPTVLLLTSDDSNATMEIANEVVRQFQRLGVRHKK